MAATRMAATLLLGRSMPEIHMAVCKAEFRDFESVVRARVAVLPSAKSNFRQVYQSVEKTLIDRAVRMDS